MMLDNIDYDKNNRFNLSPYFKLRNRYDSNDYKMNFLRRLAVLSAFFFSGYLGFRLAKKYARDDYTTHIIDLEAEDQIYNSLLKRKKPVYLYSYFPGDKFSEDLEWGV